MPALVFISTPISLFSNRSSTPWVNVTLARPLVLAISGKPIVVSLSPISRASGSPSGIAGKRYPCGQRLVVQPAGDLHQGQIDFLVLGHHVSAEQFASRLTAIEGQAR